MYTYIYIYIYIYIVLLTTTTIWCKTLSCCFFVLLLSIFLSSLPGDVVFRDTCYFFFFFFLRRASPTISTHCTSWVCICSVLYIHVYVCIYVSFLCMFFFLCIFPDKYNVLFFFFCLLSIVKEFLKDVWPSLDQSASIYSFFSSYEYFLLFTLSLVWYAHTQKKKKNEQWPDGGGQTAAIERAHARNKKKKKMLYSRFW